MIRAVGATSVYRSISAPMQLDRHGARPPAVRIATFFTGILVFDSHTLSPH